MFLQKIHLGQPFSSFFFYRRVYSLLSWWEATHGLRKEGPRISSEAASWVSRRSSSWDFPDSTWSYLCHTSRNVFWYSARIAFRDFFKNFFHNSLRCSFQDFSKPFCPYSFRNSIPNPYVSSFFDSCTSPGILWASSSKKFEFLKFH